MNASLQFLWPAVTFIDDIIMLVWGLTVGGRKGYTSSARTNWFYWSETKESADVSCDSRFCLRVPAGFGEAGGAGVLLPAAGGRTP